MKEQKHLGPLDGLRGLMAFWVLFGHVSHSTGMESVPVLRSAHYAVDGFMLLSGFLMTWHYVLRAPKEPWTSWRTWSAFYIRRYFRISPLYYLLLIPSFAMLGLYAHWEQASSAILTVANTLATVVPVDLSNVLSHLSYAFGLLPRFHASLPLPDWSISLEMQFYLVFPFLMLFVLRFGWVAFSAVATAIWLAANSSTLGYAHMFSQPSPLPMSLLWFVIGMVWAGTFAANQKLQLRWILLGCLLAVISRDPHDIILVFVFAWILFAQKRILLGGLADAARRVLSCKAAKFMADASYSVYLTHLLILRPIAYFLLTKTHLSTTGQWAIALVITTVCSYGAAIALRPIEKWGISVGRQLSRKVVVGLSAPHEDRTAGSLVQPAPQETVA